MVEYGEYLNRVALAVLDLTQERLFELSALQRRQTELLALLHRLMTRDVGAPVFSSREEWSKMLEREATAMHEANESRFQFLESLRNTSMHHAGIEVEMELQGEYVEEGENLHRRVEEARRMLKKPATEENIAEASADVGKTSADRVTPAATPADVSNVANVAETSADTVEVAATSTDVVVEVVVEATTSADNIKVSEMPAESKTTSADDAEGETASADESEEGSDESEEGESSAEEDTSEMDVDVPTSVQGPPTSVQGPPTSVQAGATSPSPSTTTGPVTVAPLINLVSATPQTSQDAPGGTVTTLHPPQPEGMPSQRRSRSRSPVPPTSPMVTRSISRGGTPAIVTEIAPESARGFKRKSPAGDDIANKKSKRPGGFK